MSAPVDAGYCAWCHGALGPEPFEGEDGLQYCSKLCLVAADWASVLGGAPRVAVLGGDRRVKIASPLQAAGAEVVSVHMSVADARRAARRRRIRALIQGVDAVVVTDAALAPFARWATKAPVVVRLRGDMRMDWQGHFHPRRLIDPVGYMAHAADVASSLRGLRMASAIVPVSEWLGAVSKRCGWANVTPRVVVPWMDAGPSDDVLPEGRVVGIVTNLEYPSKAKAVADLLPRLESLLPDDAIVWIAGEGRCRRFVEKRAGPRCHVAGYVKNAAGLVPGLDVYVHPTYGEGYPSSVVEARAAGRPIVANRHPVVEEQIIHGETGLLAGGPRSVDGVAEQVAALLEDRALARRLGAEARRRVFPEHSIQDVGRRLRGIVEHTMEARP